MRNDTQTRRVSATTPTTGTSQVGKVERYARWIFVIGLLACVANSAAYWVLKNTVLEPKQLGAMFDPNCLCTVYPTAADGPVLQICTYISYLTLFIALVAGGVALWHARKRPTPMPDQR